MCAKCGMRPTRGLGRRFGFPFMQDRTGAFLRLNASGNQTLRQSIGVHHAQYCIKAERPGWFLVIPSTSSIDIVEMVKAKSLRGSAPGSCKVPRLSLVTLAREQSMSSRLQRVRVVTKTFVFGRTDSCYQPQDILRHQACQLPYRSIPRIPIEVIVAYERLSRRQVMALSHFASISRRWGHISPLGLRSVLVSISGSQPGNFLSTDAEIGRCHVRR